MSGSYIPKADIHNHINRYLEIVWRPIHSSLPIQYKATLTGSIVFVAFAVKLCARDMPMRQCRVTMVALVISISGSSSDFNQMP